MKKLFCLSFALFAFGFQGSASAQSLPEQSISSDQLKANFCEQAKELKSKDDQEMAEVVRSSIAELDNPSIEQIVALSQIAIKLEKGNSLRSICK